MGERKEFNLQKQHTLLFKCLKWNLKNASRLGFDASFCHQNFIPWMDSLNREILDPSPRPVYYNTSLKMSKFWLCL